MMRASGDFTKPAAATSESESESVISPSSPPTAPVEQKPTIRQPIYFSDALNILKDVNTTIAQNVVHELKNISTKLENLEKLQPACCKDQQYKDYCMRLQYKAKQLAIAIKDGSPTLILEAMPEFKKVALTNLTGWQTIGKSVAYLTGTVLILSICGFALPVGSALLGLKVLSAGALMNSIVPAVTSFIATTAGKAAIGVCLAGSLYPLMKFHNWMTQSTPVKKAINTIKTEVNILSQRK